MNNNDDYDNNHDDNNDNNNDDNNDNLKRLKGHLVRRAFQ